MFFVSLSLFLFFMRGIVVPENKEGCKESVCIIGQGWIISQRKREE